MCQFSIYFEISSFMLYLTLVIFYTFIMFLSNQKHIPIIFNLMKSFKTILIILNNSLVMRIQLTCFSSHKRKDGSILHRYLSGSWYTIYLGHLEHIQSIDEHFFFLLKCFWCNIVSIDFYITMVIDHFLISLISNVDVNLEQIWISIHKFLCLSLLKRSRSKSK